MTNRLKLPTNCLITQCVAWRLTSFWEQADVVHFMNMAQHKWVGVHHVTIRPDSKITVIWLTANHVNVRFIAVCSPIENHVITPCAIFLHVGEILSPRLISINEVKQICSIWLLENRIKRLTFNKARTCGFYYNKCDNIHCKCPFLNLHFNEKT